MLMVGSSPGVRYVRTQQEVVPPLDPLAPPLVSPRLNDWIWLLWNRAAPLVLGVQGWNASGPSPFSHPTSGRLLTEVRFGKPKLVPAGGHCSGTFSEQSKLNCVPSCPLKGLAVEPHEPFGGQVTSNNTAESWPWPPPF